VLVAWWLRETRICDGIQGEDQRRLSGRKYMNIYIGQLPYSMTEEELREMFLEYGEINSLNLIKDKFSGQSKGFGFIDMPNNSEADKAIKALNKSMLKGREIKVNQAEERRKKNTFRKRRY
jgi:RNA recognition motif-containing protein